MNDIKWFSQKRGQKREQEAYYITLLHDLCYKFLEKITISLRINEALSYIFNTVKDII